VALAQLGGSPTFAILEICRGTQIGKKFFLAAHRFRSFQLRAFCVVLPPPFRIDRQDLRCDYEVSLSEWKRLHISSSFIGFLAGEQGQSGLSAFH